MTRNPILPTGSNPTPDPARIIPRTASAPGAPSVSRQDTPAPALPSDTVSLSDAAKLLARQAAGSAGAADQALSPDRVREIGQRIATGFYDRSDVRQATALRAAADLG